MSDLQDALDETDIYAVAFKHYELFREAARRVVTPNYEAMLRILWEHFYDDMEGNPSDPDEAWEYNRLWSKIQMSGLPERLFVAALGITEPAQ